jgi:hypothetical protein
MTSERDDSVSGRVLSTTKARQGITPHVTRHVLVWGLILVVAAFGVIFAVHHHLHP